MNSIKQIVQTQPGMGAAMDIPDALDKQDYNLVGDIVWVSNFHHHHLFVIWHVNWGTHSQMFPVQSLNPAQYAWINVTGLATNINNKDSKFWCRAESVHLHTIQGWPEVTTFDPNTFSWGQHPLQESQTDAIPKELCCYTGFPFLCRAVRYQFSSVISSWSWSCHLLESAWTCNWDTSTR